MKRLQRAALLVSLIETMKEKDSWCGETNIQKACYFLQKLTEVPLGYDFILYKYGPYSFELTDELTGLRADSILTLRIRDPQYGPCYAAGERGNLVKDRFPKTIRRFQDETDYVASKLGSKRVGELECLATALYVSLEKGRELSIEERASEITKLKPHIAQRFAEEAISSVDQMFREAAKLAKC